MSSFCSLHFALFSRYSKRSPLHQPVPVPDVPPGPLLDPWPDTWPNSYYTVCAHSLSEGGSRRRTLADRPAWCPAGPCRHCRCCANLGSSRWNSRWGGQQQRRWWGAAAAGAEGDTRAGTVQTSPILQLTTCAETTVICQASLLHQTFSLITGVAYIIVTDHQLSSRLAPRSLTLFGSLPHVGEDIYSAALGLVIT